LPIVLMLHGFTGQKNEISVAGHDMGLYEYTAAALAEAGIVSLRLDFIDPGRIEILGYSQGWLLGARLAAERPDAEAVVLWAAVTTPLVTYTAILGEQVVSKALAGATES